MDNFEYLKQVFKLIKDNNFIDNSREVTERFFMPLSREICSIIIPIQMKGRCGEINLYYEDWIEDELSLTYLGECILGMKIHVPTLDIDSQSYIISTPSEIGNLERGIIDYFISILNPRPDFIKLTNKSELDVVRRVTNISKDSFYYNTSFNNQFDEDIYIIRSSGFYQVQVNSVFLITDQSCTSGYVSAYNICNILNYYIIQYIDEGGNYYVSDTVFGNGLRQLDTMKSIKFSKDDLIDYITERISRLIVKLPDMKQVLYEIIQDIQWTKKYS